MVMIYNVAFRGFDPKCILEGCRAHNGTLMSPYAMMKDDCCVCWKRAMNKQGLKGL